MTVTGPPEKHLGLLDQLGAVPGKLWGWMKKKAGTHVYEAKQAESACALPLSRAAKTKLKARLASQLQKESGTKLQPLPAGNAGEEILIRRIREETERLNANNVSRTEAYYGIFKRYPELHWAFLAHMVSRNGGWSMTDLKGELIPHLLNARQIDHIFEFLERANALIFQDAYPQLLLYAESRREGRPLFHLLSLMGISAFMQPVWELFWETGDSTMLTTGLIVNEQHVIEKRVVSNPYYRKHVLDTLFFKGQSLLKLNQVVFPFTDDEDISLTDKQLGRPRLSGLIIEDFSDLRERIESGKKLYGMLFGLSNVHRGTTRFAAIRPHTGSRADYWPHLFAPIRRMPPGKYEGKLNGCDLKSNGSPLYSPRLSDVWRNRKMAPAEPGDWFDSLDCLSYFGTIEPPHSFDMSLEFCVGLHKMELAVLAGEML
jgi:hypothetical protein